ncbi:MAG TPA: hypothetical protein VN706_23595 [Gemmatimonadaceae bacterium]|nr:hypothetical protein [Gemmatimonadaceae bacterium]
MPDTIRVFVNASGVDVPRDASALDAVRAFDGAAADEVVDGRRLITDSRGLPIDTSTPMSAGSILRLIANRDRAASSDVES